MTAHERYAAEVALLPGEHLHDCELCGTPFPCAGPVDVEYFGTFYVCRAVEQFWCPACVKKLDQA